MAQAHEHEKREEERDHDDGESELRVLGSRAAWIRLGGVMRTGSRASP
ncbi:MAG TPA: hypothetical protein VGJ25_14295 [Gaiellaceae bacterium]